MQSADSVLFRLLSCIGDVYYLLLVPLLCLYLAIFVSNKFHSHQQQRQQAPRQQSTAHTRRAPDSADDTLPAASSSSLSTSAASSASPPPYASLPAIDTEYSLSDATSSSVSSSSTASTSSPSTPTASTTSPSSLSLTFLLPDQSLVNHTFPTTASISTVIATLYPPPSTLTSSARLIYQGRLLHSAGQLAQYNMSADDMVHVHLLHASHAADGGGLSLGVGGGVAGGVGEPPAVLVFVLAVMCAVLGCGWGVFVVCGDILFDMPSLCGLLCATGLTAVGVLYAHACTVGQRPVVVPI